MVKRHGKNGGKGRGRSEYVEVSLSTIEYSAIQVKARALGMSLAGFFRLAALEKAGRVAVV